MGDYNKRGWTLFCISLVIAIIAAGSASAATIYGTIYDFELNRMEQVVVSINTAPAQQLIAVNGRYTFTVQPGSYELKAEQQSNSGTAASAVESITIEKDGRYVLDI